MTGEVQKPDVEWLDYMAAADENTVYRSVDDDDVQEYTVTVEKVK